MTAPARTLGALTGRAGTGFGHAPAVLVLVAATLASVPLIVLSLTDVGHLRLVWNNLHWSMTAGAASIATIAAVAGTTGRVRRVRVGAAAAFALWLGANVVWAGLSATGSQAIPSLADAFVLAMFAPALAVLVAAIRGRVTRAEEIAVYLDSTLVALFVGSFLVLAYGPTPVGLPTTTAAIALAYPTGFIGLGAAGVIGITAARYPIGRTGPLPLVAGCIALGVAYLGWITPTVTGEDAGAIPSILFSAGTLLSAYGAVTWDDRGEPSATVLRATSWLSRVVGPAAAASLFLALVLPKDASIQPIVRWAVFIGGVMFVVRQALLLRERTMMLNEVQTLTVENDRLVGELRQELARRDRDQRNFVQASRAAAVGALAAGVAHEVNNPLTGVLGYAELALAQVGAGDPLRGDLETIRREALRARTIIRGLIDFARPRAPEMAETDVADVVRQAIDLIRFLMERRGIAIAERYDPLPPLVADSAAIQQVVLNVVTNAAEAMADDGHLAITVAAAPGGAVIRISDDGRGMDETTAAQAFEPFFTGVADDADGRSERTGLGLSVAKGLVEAMGGTIELESRPNEGTTVEIHLSVPREVAR